MLTQEDFVGPNMSGQAQQHLRRSSWKAEAIRRGDLKISGPIPITEDMPLNEDEEREYAEKYRMDAASPPRDDAAQPLSQRPQTPPPPVPPSMPSTLEPVPLTPHQTDSRPQKQEEQRESPPRKSPESAARSTLLMARGSTAEHTINSAPSPFPSIPESNGKSGPKRKRKSGLRNVFRKMFGKKGRDESQEGEREPEPEPVRRGHSYHMSEPGLIRRQTPEKRESPTTQRISNIPVETLQPLNPLGQHLPFPMNVNAPQEASPPHEYLTFDAPRPDLGRRRATLSTVHVMPGETHSWNGSRERLQPWDERHEAESQIGIALSSPPHHHPYAGQQSIQSKRRSRSAGALRDLAKGRPSIERRRSAEIRYWRDSHASGSIYSSNTRPQTARTVETVRTTGTNGTPTKAAESIVEIAPANTEPAVVTASQDPAQLPLPVEAFNFGDLKSGFSDDEDSEEPTATSHADKRLSIEDRVVNLEANVRTLESSVRRMSGRHNRQTIILENPPKGRRSSRNRSSSAASERLSLRSSGSNLALQGPAAQEATAAPRSPVLAPLSAVNETCAKPSQAEVVVEQQQRPATAIPRPDSTSSEYLAAIHDSLKHERSARKALERQVSTLQRELADLQTLVNKLLVSSPNHANGNSMYPTPSPDTLVSHNEERVSTPRAARPEFINFRADSELGYGPESVTSSREDITSPEAFVTPKEESGFGSGFFRHEK